ncbi:MAG: LamG domain-containing protein [Mesorhizobium sp.]|nr:MAG: LamG domain-containing protein [Mesorhizobium sp.]
MKTAQATANVSVMSHWSGTSRLGWGLILNNTANKLLFVGYPTSTPDGIQLLSTSNLNDGNWHSVAVNFDRTIGNQNELFIDGASQVASNATANWGNNSFKNLGAGITNGFWAAYNGHLAEVGYWSAKLSADEAKALAQGICPLKIQPTTNLMYAPNIRDVNEWRFGVTPTTVGGSASDHPRVYGF